MKNFIILFPCILLASLISCGRDEPEEKEQIEINYTQTSNIKVGDPDTNIDTSEAESNIENYSTETEDTDIDSDSGLATAIHNQIQNSNTSDHQSVQNENPNITQVGSTTTTPQKKVEVIINTPLRNLLRNAQVGKSYTKKELIEQYKFPKEAVDLIKHVTCVGPNKLYFKWGSTWLVEKVSDAKFENDTMIFTFKKNKTYVSGGAIGIKYNKKIYTELMLNNGSAYIPTVKGYHWEINK